MQFKRQEMFQMIYSIKTQVECELESMQQAIKSDEEKRDSCVKHNGRVNTYLSLQKSIYENKSKVQELKKTIDMELNYGEKLKIYSETMFTLNKKGLCTDTYITPPILKCMCEKRLFQTFEDDDKYYRLFRFKIVHIHTHLNEDLTTYFKNELENEYIMVTMYVLSMTGVALEIDDIAIYLVEYSSSSLLQKMKSMIKEYIEQDLWRLLPFALKKDILLEKTNFHTMKGMIRDIKYFLNNG